MRLVTPAAQAVLQRDLAPYAVRTLDRVVVATWVPKDGKSAAIVRKDLIEGYQARYGGSTPQRTVDELLNNVYTRYERIFGERDPSFAQKYVRAKPQVLTPSEAGIACEEPVAGSSGYGSRQLQRHAA